MTVASESRLGETFARLRAQNRKALVPYITAGDPGIEHTVPLMQAMVSKGADVIELGMPFSDPMADGAVIQRASERALKKGTRLRDVLAAVAAFRQTDAVTPVVLMGYANPLERMGLEAFGAAAKAAGVDGLIIVDYPPGESGAAREVFARHGLDMIYLLSPTSDEARIAEVCACATGYVYYVSLKGVTGAANIDAAQVAEAVARIRQFCKLPIGVGFGIRDAETARAIAGFADAVVIGSRIIQLIEASTAENLLTNVATFIDEMRRAMDGQ